MSEQPSTSIGGQSKRRWLAFGFWLALLAANIVTAYAAISAVTAGGLLSIFFQAFNRTGSVASLSDNSSGSAQLIITIVGVGLALAVIGLILNAWLKFARLSHAFIVSLAWLERDETDITIFFDWLIFPEKTTEAAPEATVEQVDLDEAENTLVGQIVKNLGIAWAILLAISPLTSLVGVFFK
jgi:hypothetical protein